MSASVARNWLIVLHFYLQITIFEIPILLTIEQEACVYLLMKCPVTKRAITLTECEGWVTSKDDTSQVIEDNQAVTTVIMLQSPALFL
jgi:hypothetical protein